MQGVFLLSAAALWLAAVIRQALSWRRSDGERRQQLKWLASGAAVCGVLGDDPELPQPARRAEIVGPLDRERVADPDTVVLLASIEVLGVQDLAA